MVFYVAKLWRRTVFIDGPNDCNVLTPIKLTGGVEIGQTTSLRLRGMDISTGKLNCMLANPACSSATWWRTARDLCGFKQTTATIVPHLLNQTNGNYASEVTDNAQLFNDVFINQNTSLNQSSFPIGPTTTTSMFALETVSLQRKFAMCWNLFRVKHLLVLVECRNVSYKKWWDLWLAFSTKLLLVDVFLVNGRLLCLFLFSRVDARIADSL